MNKIAPNHTSQTATAALAFSLGAAMAAGQPAWPTHETPSYVVAQTGPSYSQFSDQVMNTAKQYPHLDFAREMATIYASLGQRQIRLDEKFESAIFDDLESLYES